MTRITFWCAAGYWAFTSVAMLLPALLPSATPAAAQPDPDPKEIIRDMVDAHGGIYKWRNAPTVSFEDEYKPHGAAVGVISRVVVEQGRRRAYLEYPQTHSVITWDGQRAWSLNWRMGTPPRFVAFHNYYLANLAFMTMDPGVNFEYVGTARLFEDATDYLTVRMTFDPGVGDTPNDSFLLWIHPKTKELRGCTYKSTYASLLREGMKSLPERLVVYDEYAIVGGLNMPMRYTVYNMDGSKYAECEFREWSFDKSFDESRMKMPEGAVVDESTP